MQNMTKRRRAFPCGHTGRGRYCHRCQQEKQEKQKVTQAKEEWREQLASSPIPLVDLPPAVATRAFDIITELKAGAPYRSFKGKRMVTIGQREIISVPVGRRYRLVCREVDGLLEFLEIISHEEYNNRLSARGWVG